jgi:hypothetical protein
VIDRRALSFGYTAAQTAPSTGRQQAKKQTRVVQNQTKQHSTSVCAQLLPAPSLPIFKTLFRGRSVLATLKVAQANRCRVYSCEQDLTERKSCRRSSCACVVLCPSRGSEYLWQSRQSLGFCVSRMCEYPVVTLRFDEAR